MPFRLNHGRPALAAPSTESSYSYSYTLEPWFDDDYDSYGKSRVVVEHSVRTQTLLQQPLLLFYSLVICRKTLPIRGYQGSTASTTPPVLGQERIFLVSKR